MIFPTCICKVVKFHTLIYSLTGNVFLRVYMVLFPHASIKLLYSGEVSYEI